MLYLIRTNDTIIKSSIVIICIISFIRQCLTFDNRPAKYSIMRNITLTNKSATINYVFLRHTGKIVTFKEPINNISPMNGQHVCLKSFAKVNYTPIDCKIIYLDIGLPVTIGAPINDKAIGLNSTMQVSRR